MTVATKNAKGEMQCVMCSQTFGTPTANDAPLGPSPQEAAVMDHYKAAHGFRWQTEQLTAIVLNAVTYQRTGGGPFYRDSQNIPPEMKASIDAHVMTGKPTGSFLQAVLENDLKTAVVKADESNYLLLGAIVGYCCNEIPVICWGSEDAVAAWRRKGGWLAVYPGEPVRLKGLVVK